MCCPFGKKGAGNWYTIYQPTNGEKDIYGAEQVLNQEIFNTNNERNI